MNALHSLLKVKMTRKQFLFYVLGALFVISGISSRMNEMKQIAFFQKIQKKGGFGGGAYGS